MANFGLTPEGFKPKRLADLLADLNADLAKVKDPETGEYLDPAIDPLIAQLSAILMPGLAECWEAATDAANQFDPLKAQGACLAGLVQLNGILKFPGTFTRVMLLLHGTGTLAAGQQIGNDNATVVFITDNDVVFVEGSATVEATCSKTGAIEPESGTITNILTPSDQWNTAQNIATLIVGTEPETDEQLRTRQQIETSNTSYRQVESIQAAVTNIKGVIFCKVFQNASATDIDAHTLPPKTVCALVEGGQDLDVANAIFKRSPIGLGYYGATTLYLNDSQGFDYPISFQRPIPVIVTVIIDISVVDTSFPSDGKEQIAAAIVAYAQYKGGSNGIPPAHNVILSRLYTPINSIPGHQINSVLLSRDHAAPTAANVAISWNEAAQFIGSLNYFATDDSTLCADVALAWIVNAPSSSINISIT